MNLVFPSLKLCFEYSENSRDFCFYKIFLVLSWQLLLNFSEGFHYYGETFGVLTSYLLHCFKHTKKKATCSHCLSWWKCVRKEVDSVSWSSAHWRVLKLERWLSVAVEWGDTASWFKVPGGCLPCFHQNILCVGRCFQCYSLLPGLLRCLASPSPSTGRCDARCVAEQHQ